MRIPFQFGKFPKDLSSYFESPNMGNSFKSYPKVLGADLVSGTTATHTSGNLGFLTANKLSLGNIGEYYDRIAGNVFNAVGNERLAVYDDVAGSPTNLLAETGSIVSANGFNWRSVTEFVLPTTQCWAVFQVSDNTSDWYGQTQASGNQQYKLQVYGAAPNPFGVTINATFNFNMKVGHS